MIGIGRVLTKFEHRLMSVVQDSGQREAIYRDLLVCYKECGCTHIDTTNLDDLAFFKAYRQVYPEGSVGEKVSDE